MPSDISSKLPSDINKCIAWNNTSVQVPQDWEVDSLDVDHLIIGKDSTPKIELKWIESPKKFTLEKFLKKFIAQSQRQLNITIEEQPTPNNFSHPFKPFDFFFFTWRGHGTKGTGTLIFCQHCKRLTLFRFFKTNHLSPTYKQILMTFSDHPQKTDTHWSVFGMDIKAPAKFKLEDYSFKPGAFHLDLLHQKTKLYFYNWGPASFLLSKTDLSAFAIQRLPQLSGFAQTGTCQKGSYLEWVFKQNRFKNAQLIPFTRHLDLFTMFRICYDTEQNRILGVLITSPKQFEHDLIKETLLGDI